MPAENYVPDQKEFQFFSSLYGCRPERSERVVEEFSRATPDDSRQIIGCWAQHRIITGIVCQFESASDGNKVSHGQKIAAHAISRAGSGENAFLLQGCSGT